MRKTLMLLLILEAATGFIVSAQTASQKQGEQQFSITITPLTTEVKAGSEPSLKVRMTNTSDHDLSGRGVFVDMRGLNSMYRYDCRDAAGKSVTRNTEGPGMGSVHDVPALKPGESREDTVPIGRACDFSRAGEYEIQLSSIIPGDPQHRAVKSNRIKITVNP